MRRRAQTRETRLIINNVGDPAAGRELLEAFVCLDVDLVFAGHASAPGRGLPTQGRFTERVASAKSVAELSTK